MCIIRCVYSKISKGNPFLNLVKSNRIFYRNSVSIQSKFGLIQWGFEMYFSVLKLKRYAGDSGVKTSLLDHFCSSYATCVTVTPLVRQLRHLCGSYATCVTVTPLILAVLLLPSYWLTIVLGYLF